MTVTNKEIAQQFAERLLDIEAVSLSPDAPFTWASGLHSPIYCDNRVTLSDPQIRDLIASGLADLVRANFDQVDVVAGTATAGIAHAALAADRLGPHLHRRLGAQGCSGRRARGIDGGRRPRLVLLPVGEGASCV